MNLIPYNPTGTSLHGSPLEGARAPRSEFRTCSDRRRSRDRAAHPRPRDRRGVRPARRDPRLTARAQDTAETEETRWSRSARTTGPNPHRGRSYATQQELPTTEAAADGAGAAADPSPEPVNTLGSTGQTTQKEHAHASEDHPDPRFRSCSFS